MRMINLGGSEGRLAVSVEVGPAYEFLISLAALGSTDQWETFDLGSAWFRQVESSLSREVRQAWTDLGRDGGKVWLNLLPLARQTGPPFAVASLISRLRRLSGTELRRHFFGYHLPTGTAGADRGLIDRAVGGDPDATRALLESRTYFEGEATRLAAVLRLDPHRTKALAMRLVQGWNQEFFRDRSTQFLPALERDATAKRMLLETTTPERGVELATGIVCQPTPGLHEIRLIPQFAFRPWNVYVQQGALALWCYPMADESLDQDPGAPPRQLVRLVKAIADEKRLRILRALSAKDATLQELTEALGMPRSTVHHHLLALRSAGLVRMTSEGEVRYALQREALAEPSALLKAFLGDLA